MIVSKGTQVQRYLAIAMARDHLDNEHSHDSKEIRTLRHQMIALSTLGQ